MANGEGKEFRECARKLWGKEESGWLPGYYRREEVIDLLARAMELAAHATLNLDLRDIQRDTEFFELVAARISERLEREK